MDDVIERLPLGTPYPAVANRVAEIVSNLEALNGTRPDLVVDTGGVGVAVVDLFRERKLRPVPVTIVAGVEVNEREDGSLTIGKGHLVGSLEVAFQSGRLHFPEGEDGDVLENELMDYQRKITPAGNQIFNARSGKHDDVVLAAALAVAVDIPRKTGAVAGWGSTKGGWLS